MQMSLSGESNTAVDKILNGCRVSESVTRRKLLPIYVYDDRTSKPVSCER